MWGFYGTEEAKARAQRTRHHHDLCSSTVPVLGPVKPFNTDWIIAQLSAHWE